MSLIEGDAYFPLFSTAEIPIDFSAAGLVPDSPGKLQQFVARRSSFALSNSQTVPANVNLQNLGPLDEPLFSLFMNGPDKMDLNNGFVKGLQMPDELLLQSNLVPDARKFDGMMMGMDQRQFVQMGILPDPMINGDFNLVPQLATNNMIKPATPPIEDTNVKGSNARKRKFIQNPVKGEPPGMPIPDGQPLTPEEERNMKRQRRLVKNREAAQLFRQRQKAYILDLEKKVADLSATNNEYRARVELLNSENKLIKEQLLYLRNFITQAVSFSFPKSPGDENSTVSPNSLLGPLPPGLTLPPEILGAMGNMPSMALGLMGAMGPNGTIPGLPLPANIMESLANASISGPSQPALQQVPAPSAPATRPPQSPAQMQQQPAPLVPHMDSNSIKLAGTPKQLPGTINIAAVSPVAIPSTIPTVPNIPPISPGAALIPPPHKPLNTSSNNANAVVPQFLPSSPVTVPDSFVETKVKFDSQGKIISSK